MEQIKAGMTVHEAIRILVCKGLKRHLIMNILGNIAGIILGPGFILMGFMIQKNPDSDIYPMGIVSIIIGVICSGILVIAAVQLFIQIISNKKVLLDFSEGNKKLVWMYVESRTGETTGIPVKGTITVGPFFHIHYFLNDGTKTRGWLNTSDMINLYNMADRFMPDINLGWDRDLYKKWKKNPGVPEGNIVRNRHMKPYTFRTSV